MGEKGGGEVRDYGPPGFDRFLDPEFVIASGAEN